MARNIHNTLGYIEIQWVIPAQVRILIAAGSNPDRSARFCRGAGWVVREA